MAAPSFLEALPPDYYVTDSMSRAWPHIAALARIIQASGPTHGTPIPDKHHVLAISRHDSAALDVDTAFGAAVSFNDQGYDVVLMGEPSRIAVSARPAEIRYWLDTLTYRTRSNGQSVYSATPPTAEDVRGLVNDPEGPWAVLLYLAGKAFDKPDVAVQPTFVLSCSETVLSVYNPGSQEIAPCAAQDLQLTHALGIMATDRVSLLAVRHPKGDIGSVSLVAGDPRTRRS